MYCLLISAIMNPSKLHKLRLGGSWINTPRESTETPPPNIVSILSRQIGYHFGVKSKLHGHKNDSRRSWDYTFVN